MATKNRSDLKSYFVKNAIPTEGNFADLVDSQLNQAQDGVFKPDGDALTVTAALGDQKRVLRLYASYPAANPDWMISLNPAQDPANAASTSRPGFGVTDGTGRTRLFIDAATGQIGVGTNDAAGRPGRGGTAQANGFRGRYDLVLNDYRTVNPASNVCLQSPAERSRRMDLPRSSSAPAQQLGNLPSSDRHGGRRICPPTRSGSWGTPRSRPTSPWVMARRTSPDGLASARLRPKPACT